MKKETNWHVMRHEISTKCNWSWCNCLQNFNVKKYEKILQLSADMFFLNLQLSACGAFSNLEPQPNAHKMICSFLHELVAAFCQLSAFAQFNSNHCGNQTFSSTQAACRLALPNALSIAPVSWEIVLILLESFGNISNTSRDALWSLWTSTESLQWAKHHL